MANFLNMAQQAAQSYMGQQNHPPQAPPSPMPHNSFGGPSPYHPGPGGPPPQQPQYQGPPPPPHAPPAPPCRAPWIPIWDDRAQRYYFEDTHTRQTTWEYPGPPPGFAPPPSGGSPYPAAGHQNVTVTEKEKSHSGGGYGKVALGVAGGAIGGALLAHGAHEVHESWEEDKHRVEERFERPYEGGHAQYRREYGESEYGRRPEYVSEERREYIDDRPGYTRESETVYYEDDEIRRRREYGDRYDTGDYVEERVETYGDDAARWAGRQEERIEDFPDNAARWTGEKVQEVEDIPENIEQSYDRFEDRVEDFGDRVEDDFDAGRAEQYDDDRGDGGW
ncbi:MAG: hypothetical protein Q9159_005172 [Coniocarpon cinnabarinum]